MTRTHVITGAASGIGAATRELLERDGDRVIGVDLRNTDVCVDLSSPQGRLDMVAGVTAASGGTIDSIIACAGVGTESHLSVTVNYFGALATLEGLRPLLAQSTAPRAVAIASVVVAYPTDDELVTALEAGDQDRALARATQLIDAGEELVYSSAKKALATWIRRNALLPEWAGAGIPLNAVGPGVVLTPLNDTFLDTEEKYRQHTIDFPTPLNGFLQADVIAQANKFLVSEANTHITGQILYVDGGCEASVRPHRVL